MKQKPEDDHKSDLPGKKPSNGAEKKPEFAKHKDIDAAFDGKSGFDAAKGHNGDHKGPGALAAKAYAMGEKIAMRTEKPGNGHMGHELAHVVQQGDGKHSYPDKLNGSDGKKPDGIADKLDGSDGKKPSELLSKLAAGDGKLPDEVLHKLKPADLKKPEKVLRKLEKMDGKKPFDLPFKQDLEAAFKADFKQLGRLDAPQAMDGVGANAFAMDSKLTFSDPPDMKFAAHEAVHTLQQGGDGKHADKTKPKEPEYLKHPDAKHDDGKSANGKNGENGKSKPNGSTDAKSKPKLPADTQGKLQVPLDSELLHALSEKLSQKIERDVKSEIDATGKKLPR